MTHLFIQPTDVLVFRDGRPFDAGSDHLATGPFPPPPTTLYGALRSALLAAHGADFRADDFGVGDRVTGVTGTRTELGSLAITAFALARRAGNGRVERLYPAPLDLLTRKTKQDEAGGDPPHVLLLPQEPPAGVRTNLPEGLRLLHRPHRTGTFYGGTGALLTETGLSRVLAGTAPEAADLVAPEQVFRREPRTQVSLRGASDERFTGTAQEGKLFTVEFVRMREHAGFAVSVEASGLLGSAGLLRLGGESRPARFEAVDLPGPDAAALRAKAAETGRVKILLTTPAPFRDGWRPDGISDDLRGALGGVAVRLVAAAVGRPLTLGGWDLVHRRPKRARPAAPAGSVYFLELDRPADAPALFDALDGRSLCTDDEALQGLGLARLGIW